MISRREFVRLGATAVASAMMPWPMGLGKAGAAVSPQTPLAASAIRQFVEPAPDLMDADHLVTDNGLAPVELVMREHRAMVLPAGTVPGYAGTYVWSYLKPQQATRASYIGPVIAVTRGIATQVKFVNQLGSAASTRVLAYRYSTDQTINWADPLGAKAHRVPGVPRVASAGAQNYAGSIPACVHLHGGEVPPLLDGNPNAWFTSDGAQKGKRFYSKDGAAATNYCIYNYPNSQESAFLWFHDQTLGAARLSLYAGLAGAYLIQEPLTDPARLPRLFPLVIQDRMFDNQGQLFFPAANAGGIPWAPNPEHPYWVPDFYGDVVVVNGKSWPYMDVEQRRYTFLLLNASNARTFELSLWDPASGNPGPPMWVIGTDGGFLDVPVRINPAGVANRVLPVMPGERYWVIVDFAGYGPGALGTNGHAYSGSWILRNGARTPYPAGPALKSSPVSRVMQFRVAAAAAEDSSYDPALGEPLRTPIIRLADLVPDRLRRLTLNEVTSGPVSAVDPASGRLAAYPGGPLEFLLNNTRWSGGRRLPGVDRVEGLAMEQAIPGFARDGITGSYVSERPKEGDTEVWEVINLTGSARAIHLHLVQFQVLSRRAFDVKAYTAAYESAFPGGYHFVAKATLGPGAFIPAFGPPLDYYAIIGADAPAAATPEPQPTAAPRPGGMPGQDGGGMGSAGEPLPPAGAIGGNPDVTPYLKGPEMEPRPHESGWKDTAMMLPGQVTRIAMRWAPTEIATNLHPNFIKFPFSPGGKPGYAWGCQIAAHGDNSMIRPAEVEPKALFRDYLQGIDY